MSRYFVAPSGRTDRCVIVFPPGADRRPTENTGIKIYADVGPSGLGPIWNLREMHGLAKEITGREARDILGDKFPDGGPSASMPRILLESLVWKELTRLRIAIGSSHAERLGATEVQTIQRKIATLEQVHSAITGHGAADQLELT